MVKIKIKNLARTIEARPGLNLLNNFILGKAPVHTICGGRARCGCCRIRILEGEKGMSPVNSQETARLGQALIDEHWRLSCQSYVLRDITIHLPGDGELDGFCSE